MAESKCPHCGKLPSDLVFRIESILFPTLYTHMGCSSSGFCHNCNIFYWDSTCFCMGTTCYKCGEKVIGKYSSPPKDLPDGIYEYRCWHTTEMREYKDGKFGETISKTRLPGNEWMDKK